MNYSFYGGNQGAAFVIVERFRYKEESLITDYDKENFIDKEWGSDKSIQTYQDWVLRYCMKEAFSQGGDYTGVNYDEYVIIDSFNKNDTDNGKIYRRGYDYTDELGGAQYIGQVVGPSGPAPQMEMDTIANIEAMSPKEDKKNFEYRESSGSYNTTNSLVPGKTDDGQFNDAIQWKCYSIRDTHNKDTIAYIGLSFPYTVIDFQSETKSPYDSNGNYNDTSDATRIDDKQHPFYEKWKFTVPKGVKGDTFKNLRLMTAGDEEVQGHTWTQTEIDEKRQVLVYDYYHYDSKNSGERVTVYLGDCNRISGVSIDTDSGSGEGSGSQKIRIHFDDGTFSDIGEPLNYIIKTKITDDYHFIVLYSDPVKRQEILSSHLNYPKTIEGHNDWYDMGSVRSDHGLLIGYHYDTDIVPEMGTKEGGINYLNANFPKGLTDTGVYGKIVTSGKGSENKIFFAFNYDYVDPNATPKTYKGWYFLGAFGDLDIVCGRDDAATQEIAKKLPTGGIWLVTAPKTN